MTPAGLPHSEIPGSTRVNRSPRLIAACHVLRRLPMPRHSPLALSSLSIKPDKTNLISLRSKPKTNSATVTPRITHPGGFRVTLLFDCQRSSRYSRCNFRHDVLMSWFTLSAVKPTHQSANLIRCGKLPQGRGLSFPGTCLLVPGT